jgi:hypothetical protein
MESWGVAFLGVIALASVVQVAGLVALAALGLRLARRLSELQGRLDRELAPALADLARASRSVAELAELAHARGRHVDGVLGATLDRVSDAASVVAPLAGPFKAASSALALVLALRRGLRFLRR